MDNIKIDTKNHEIFHDNYFPQNRETSPQQFEISPKLCNFVLNTRTCHFWGRKFSYFGNDFLSGKILY